MSAQQRTFSFMRVVSSRIKDFALVEIFDGDETKLAGKLALDHIVPAIWMSGASHKMHLVCRINHQESGTYVQQVFYAVSYFQVSQVLAGGQDWVGIANMLSYPLIKALNNQLDTLTDAKMLKLEHNQGCAPEMRRINIG